MIKDEALAGILEDLQQLDEKSWTACIHELRRDAAARADLRALLRQDEQIAQVLGRARPAVLLPKAGRQPRRGTRMIFARRWAMTAAAAAATIAVTLVICLPGKARATGVTLVHDTLRRPVSAGERIAPGAPSILLWDDGSRVSLSAAAIARVESASQLRLEGGFCHAEVTPDASRTFRVVTAQAEVAVLGTAFTVSCLKAATEVSVERGLVKVSGLVNGAGVSLGAGTTTRIGSDALPEQPRRRWPLFSPAEIVAQRGALISPNARLADGIDGPELASAFQYPKLGITGIRLVPTEPVAAVAGLRLHLRYRATQPIGRLSVQCMNTVQTQNFIAPLPSPPADGAWIQVDIALAEMTPILRQTPWLPGETIGNVLVAPDTAQTVEDLIRLGDFAFTAPLTP